MSNHTPIRNLPVKDYDVTFVNLQDGITLAGTLSVPESEKKPAVVILIAGVGPYDRDCVLLNGGKLFEAIAEYFTQRGIAVLRYDKRGVGKSGGVFETTVTSDFARDARAAVGFLKKRSDINTKKIGLVGHSEGGLIAFQVASQLPEIAFIVSLAAAVITKIDDLLAQAEMLFKASGGSQEFIAHDRVVRKQILEIVTHAPILEAKQKLVPLMRSYVKSMSDSEKAMAAQLQPFALTEENYTEWVDIFSNIWRGILHGNSTEFMSKITIPVLAINGELDFIIPAQLALPIIKDGLKRAGDADVTIMPIAEQNHCFQQCRTGALSEYAQIKETVNTSTLKLIADWILARV